ncbi:hypothetical protein LY78DRAFT_93534 [Colletotrichum sublineola]|nr:hypothetical protein LY78DRAFT_93534 [Colletotrichum sublineola]
MPNPLLLSRALGSTSLPPFCYSTLSTHPFCHLVALATCIAWSLSFRYMTTGLSLILMRLGHVGHRCLFVHCSSSNPSQTPTTPPWEARRTYTPMRS